MVKFICNTEECPNIGLQYNFVDGYATAQCGGCETILEAQPLEEEENNG
jgi:hypothetical protein